MRFPRPLILFAALLMLGAACADSGVDTATDLTAADAAVAYEDGSESGASFRAVDTVDAADAADDEGGFAEIDVQLDGDERVGGDAALTGSTGVQDPLSLPDLGRDIIYTADLDLGATDVTIATREAIRTIEALGGFVFSQDTSGGANGRSRIVFKILPEYFHQALEDLGGVGAVRAQSISADDVTSVVVDLESRIKTAEASVQRLRGLLDDANDINVIASLESQLLSRETTLEQLRGQLRSVRGQVDLATINVTVSELLNRPSLGLSVATYEGHDGGFRCLDGLRTSTVPADAPLTVCYTIFNAGDTDLVDLSLDDPTLGAGLDSMLVVEGNVAALAPGESVVLAHEIEVTESIRLRTTASASALDADGNRIDDVVVATGPRLRIDVLPAVDEGGLPGFGEVLSGSWRILATIVVMIALAAVAVAPFLLAALALAPLAWWAAKRLRRSDGHPEEQDPTIDRPADEEDDSADVRDEVEGTTVSA